MCIRVTLLETPWLYYILSAICHVYTLPEDVMYIDGFHTVYFMYVDLHAYRWHQYNQLEWRHYTLVAPEPDMTIFLPLILTLTTLKYYLFKPWRLKLFLQFEIILNVLIISFRFIWIHMLWVYDHYNYFNFFSAVIVFMSQNLTSTDVRFWRIKTVPALKGLTLDLLNYLFLYYLTQFPASNDEKTILLMKNAHLQYWIIGLTEAFTKK